ncbi:MAG: recombination mediator RecR [Bacteroidota bacterium]|nr:recombination mediator RecR [Bacteroidota bacterium]MDP4231963.1 recombination mediator RecR [Bacteroidota bacterium]MDP4241330.1 recombination mediator RecR [Bacteroidota bacterium]MDP4287251.1 recombination mediator RecR [Bacteroidota bacterium]
MLYTSPALETLIERLSRLPTVGRKTAQRLALYLLKQPAEESLLLARAIGELHERVHTCTICANITDEDPCPICRDMRRDRSIICVVEEPNDVLTIERTNEFRGLYHVLGGSLSPLEGIGPDELKIRELLDRLSPDGAEPVREIILAMDPNVEGEATTLYLAKLLHPIVERVTRIARGIPIGSDLEFADQATLARALEGRTAV